MSCTWVWSADLLQVSSQWGGRHIERSYLCRKVTHLHEHKQTSTNRRERERGKRPSWEKLRDHDRETVWFLAEPRYHGTTQTRSSCQRTTVRGVSFFLCCPCDRLVTRSGYTMSWTYGTWKRFKPLCDPRTGEFWPTENGWMSRRLTLSILW